MHFRFLFYIWVRVDCRPTSQQIYKRTSSNLIRKGTGCDEYVEDQLNVASKNFAKYLFDDTDGKRYLEDICSMKGWSEKNAILNFFSRHDLTALHTKFHTSQTPPFMFLSDPYRSDLEDPFILLVLVLVLVMLGPTSRNRPIIHFQCSADPHNHTYSESS